MAVSNNGVHTNPITYTDLNPSTRFFIGTTAPTNQVNGDIWMDASPLNNSGKNAISTGTLTTGSTFTFSVPAGYKDTVIVLRNVTASAAANLTYTVNSNTANYAGLSITGNGTGAALTTGLFAVPLAAGVTTNSLILTLQDTQDTTSFQMGRLEGATSYAIIAAGAFTLAAALTTVTITLSAGTFTNAGYTVYGVN